MKGYDHVASSALYVANCSEKDAKEKCTVGSNPLEFLHIVDGKQFLPAEANLQYSYAKVSDDCPKPKSNWVNLWTGIKLLDYVPTPNSVGTKGYTAYESAKFKGNMDSFIKKVKSEIKNKGSVIAYVNAEDVMGFDFNGKKVHNLCGDGVPNHAVNIVGYSNYINADGEKKSYWIVKNSWGKYWGDEGNFKVDMYTPAECKNNFIHTAAVFNLDLPIVEKPVKAEAELYNYYLKSSPDFYSNLYYKNYSKAKNGVASNGSVTAQSDTVHGQADNALESSAITLSRPTSSSEQPSQGSLAGVGTGVGPAAGPGPAQENTPGAAEIAGNPQGVVSLDRNVANLPSGSHTRGLPPNSDGATTASNAEVVHILKHIKNAKRKVNIVKYKNAECISADHDCSRSYALKMENHEKCVQICEDKLSDCLKDASPSMSLGFCLSKFDEKKECFFCYV
ncbi:Papain family cysteine protease, putative [Plasmodium ovale]|uniref:Papain family cysteine protease, putative n=1 Tax=Plasmodium ovale TaxID=36330 RepID=A0A1C3KHG8_PLAOA|nr:Papain family cysteine protease, putative [Plasmodium ovale]